MHAAGKVGIAFALGLVGAVAGAEPPPLHVTGAAGVVEIDNGLVKARFTAGKDGVKQEYLAGYPLAGGGGKWAPVAESLRPPRPLAAGANVLYDSARDPAHRLIVSEILDTVGQPRRENGQVTIELSGRSQNRPVRQRITLGEGRNYARHRESRPTWSRSSQNWSICSPPSPSVARASPTSSIPPRARGRAGSSRKACRACRARPTARNSSSPTGAFTPRP